MRYFCTSRSLRCWLSGCVGLLAVAVTRPLPAQAPTPPPHFAIRNARIVTGAGETITGGTIVMEDGLITAVGRNVTVPADAGGLVGGGGEGGPRPDGRPSPIPPG